MNIKLIFGIVIPSFIIIVLVVLSRIDIGVSINKETVESVQFNSLFTNQSQTRNNIPIQTITLNNNFFLSKKFELPKLIVCLNDKEGLKQRENLQVRYSEGRYSIDSDIPIFQDLIYDDHSYYSSKQTVEVPANSKKQVKILVEPKYIYDYGSGNEYAKNVIESNKLYDELLLIQKKNNGRYYYSCNDLSSKELDSAIRIALIK